MLPAPGCLPGDARHQLAEGFQDGRHAIQMAQLHCRGPALLTPSGQRLLGYLWDKEPCRGLPRLVAHHQDSPGFFFFVKTSI